MKARVVAMSSYCYRLNGRSIEVIHVAFEGARGESDMIVERTSLDPPGEWRELPIHHVHYDPERPPTAGRRGGRRG